MAKYIIFVHGLGGEREKTWGRFPEFLINEVPIKAVATTIATVVQPPTISDNDINIAISVSGITVNAKKYLLKSIKPPLLLS